MIIEQWLLIETLDGPGTWSVLAVGTAPRRWKSLARTVSARLRPIVAAAHDCREPVARDLPRSRHPWSSRHARAIPVLGADGRVYGVRFWVGTGEPPEPPRVSSFRLDSRTRRIEVDATALDPTFDPGRTVWIGAETFEHVERFDQALDLVAILLRAEPGSRWLGEITVRTPAGLRTLLLAVRNGIDSPHEWRGLLADVTDSVPPLGKSFEATTVDALVNTNPGPRRLRHRPRRGLHIGSGQKHAGNKKTKHTGNKKTKHAGMTDDGRASRPVLRRSGARPRRSGMLLAGTYVQAAAWAVA
ncbi:GAF domain-containing protein [Nocardia terpenica]|uniref:Rv3651-like N-terminal domain-containing protein n=1 Tax=Nocardia terpenica TaxID=455432 RepID=A0A164I8W3_9NOCA|nr:GAF domain-containing protein [Nocardia terpenica]KZM69207.1 hypothetical protein AWN90_15975 [Nocardia terpenica]